MVITLGICPEGKISYLSHVGPAAEAAGRSRDSWIGTVLWAAVEFGQQARARAAFADCLLTGEDVTAQIDSVVGGIRERWRVQYRRVRLPIAVMVHSQLIEERDDRCLSQREREIVSLIVRDGTITDIAEELGLCESTVTTHLANIRAKLGVKTTAGIAVFGLRAGL